MKKVLPILPVLLLALVAGAEKQPFERYQSIVDRQMFGPLPPGFDPEKLPSEVARSAGGASAKELTKEQEQLQSAVHFSVLNIEKDGKPVVGFTDNSDPKAPVHYYLHVGESQNGWEVKEADPEAATMTIVKDGQVEVTLTLGDNSAKGGGTTAAAGTKGAEAAGAARGLRGRGLLGGSLSARRAARRQAEQEAAQKTAAEQAAREAERQERENAEKAEREAERAAQRQQLQAIQEELRKTREARAAEAEKEGENGGNEVQ